MGEVLYRVMRQWPGSAPEWLSARDGRDEPDATSERAWARVYSDRNEAVRAAQWFAGQVEPATRAARDLEEELLRETAAASPTDAHKGQPTPPDATEGQATPPEADDEAAAAELAPSVVVEVIDPADLPPAPAGVVVVETIAPPEEPPATDRRRRRAAG